MKIVFYSFIAIVILAISVPLIISAGNGPEVISHEVKVAPYKTLTELERDSEIIILGEKTSGKPKFTSRADFNTESTIAPLKIFKGRELIKNDKKINILEAAAKKDGKIYTLNDYQLMEKNKPYLLFLRGSRTDAGKYVLISVAYGKIDLSSPPERGQRAHPEIIEDAKDKYSQ